MLRILVIMLWLCVGTLFLVASIPQNTQASMLTYAVPKITLTLAQPTIQPGAQQTIDVQIDELPGRLTSLILVVTYPNGETSRSLHSIEDGMGSITWTVPTDAGAGKATFQLIADGCTCGEKNTIPRQPAVDGTVEGTFVVGAVP